MVELYLHFYSQLRLHVVVLNKAQAGEHQLHRALSGEAEKSRGVIWTGRFYWAKDMKKKDQLEDQGVDRIIIKQI
jgi:hypothetical protein